MRGLRDMDDRNKNNKKKTCCICGEEFEGWGNNPAPVKDEGICCDKCNFEKVIPERMKLVAKIEKL